MKRSFISGVDRNGDDLAAPIAQAREYDAKFAVGEPRARSRSVDRSAHAHGPGEAAEIALDKMKARRRAL